MVKETRSATMNIFRNCYFLFKSFVKVELSYVFTTRKSELSYKQVCLYLVGIFLRPSNNYRQLILTQIPLF